MKKRAAQRVAPLTQERSPDADETNWLAWGLQFALGFVVGLFVGFLLAAKLVRADFIGRSQTSPVVFGLALVIGAAAAYLGDRAWLPASIFDPPEFPRGEKALRASGALSTLGLALVLVPSVLHVLAGDAAPGGSAVQGTMPLRLLIAAIPIGFTVYALRGGTALGVFGTVERGDGAVIYWIHVAVAACSAACLIFGR